MKGKIANQFLKNYILMFVISIVITLFAFLLMDFASHVISTTLVKNNYSAQSIMQDDYSAIDTAPVIQSGGGVQVVDASYQVVFSAGLNTIQKDKLTTEEFTDFLINSKNIGNQYSYSVKYNAKGQFWLIVTFPTSIRIDFAIVHNKDFASADLQNVTGVIVAVVLFYLLLLAVSTVIYSKITSIGIINPLRKLLNSTKRLQDGDYSARVDLDLKNEFAELQDTFNAMAGQIEREITLRKRSEENRKKLVLDISHDLKNPLASIMGYAELCRGKEELSQQEREAYLKIICKNSIRANHLITSLFELSKMESSEFTILKTKADVCEYVREKMGESVPILDEAGFTYEFNIPEDEIFAMLDKGQMDRVFQNLVANTLWYNPKGTKVTSSVQKQDDEIVIIFKDDGIGIPAEMAKDIFLPFVRVDTARNSQTGGKGLGLAIVQKIILAHGGNISLKTELNEGCEFTIRLPQI